MDASVIKTLSYGAKILQNPCISSSEDGSICIAHDSGIYILEQRCSPSESDAQTVWHVCSISPPAKTLEFELGVDRVKLMEVLTQDELHTLMLDRTLSPSIKSSVSFLGYKSACWSPLGADQFGRCVLATLTMDHRLCLYEELNGKQQWKMVSDLSLVLYEAMKGEDFALVSNRISKDNRQNIRLQLLQQRSFALAALAMAWSPLYLGRPSSVDTSNFALLAAVMKGGHMVLWKILFPLNRQKMEVVEVVDSGQDVPSSVCWCQVTENIGLVVVGFHNGLVRTFATERRADDDFNIWEASVLWEEADAMPVTKLTWCTKERVLLIAKGPYLLAFELTWSKKKLQVTNRVAKLLSGKSPIIDLVSSSHGNFAAVQDNTIYRLFFNKDKGLSVLTEDVTFARDRKYVWGGHGVAVSQNAAFLLAVESPAQYYCHLTLKMALKVHILENCSIDHSVDLLLKDDGVPLRCLRDCLARVQTAWLASAAFPPRLDQLLASNTWQTAPAKALRLVRYLLRLRTEQPGKTQLAEDISRVYTAMINDVESLLMSAHIRTHLKVITGSKQLLKDALLFPTECVTLRLMCEFLKCHAPGPETDRLTAAPLQALASTTSSQERCSICQQDVAWTSLISDGCSKGHVFGRCSQTLLLCQELPQRACSMCGALAINTDIPGSSWLKQVRSYYCTYCDFILT